MTKHVYVGNLSLATTPETLRNAFSKDGRTVSKIALVTNPKTGRPRGFGFVEMQSEEEAQAVIRELDGTLLDGRPIKVGEGKERPEIQIRAATDEYGPRGGGRRRSRS